MDNQLKDAFNPDGKTPLQTRFCPPTAKEVDEGETFFQILLNSHSPVVLSCLEEGEAMFADLVSVVNPEVGSVSRKTRIRPVATCNGKQEYVSRFEVERYLSSVDRES